ncbi:MAG: hypothetical protein AAGN46_06395 [Acidobacteriota bacterium]
MRRLIANLAAEDAWATGSGRSARPLSRAAADAAASWGSLLRVFARGEDRLDLLAPIDRRRLTDALPRPRLHLVDFDHTSRRTAGEAELWWAAPQVQPTFLPGEAGREAIDALVRTATRDLHRAIPDVSVARALLRPQRPTDLGPRLWATPPPAGAARAADRRLVVALAARLGVGPPGARPIDTVDDLRRAIAGEPDLGGPWVLKSALSAAGRHRLWSNGARFDEEAVARLLQRGPAVVEPWDDRRLDAGLRLWIDDRPLRGEAHGTDAVEPLALVGWHALEVGARGRFLGIETGRSLDDTLGGLDDAEALGLARALRALGFLLQDLGVRGPVALDLRRTREGVLRPLGEINPRLSFGYLAAEIARRLTADGRVERAAGRLRAIPRASKRSSLGIRLLEPDASGGGGLVFEPESSLKCLADDGR